MRGQEGDSPPGGLGVSARKPEETGRALCSSQASAWQPDEQYCVNRQREHVLSFTSGVCSQGEAAQAAHSFLRKSGRRPSSFRRPEMLPPADIMVAAKSSGRPCWMAWSIWAVERPCRDCTSSVSSAHK